MAASMPACILAWLAGCLYGCLYASLYPCLAGCLYGCLHASLHSCLAGCLYASLHSRLAGCLYGCLYASLYACMHACIYACLPVYPSAYPPEEYSYQPCLLFVNMNISMSSCMPLCLFACCTIMVVPSWLCLHICFCFHFVYVCLKYPFLHAHLLPACNICLSAGPCVVNAASRYKFIKLQSALQRKSHFCIPFLGFARSQSQFPNLCFCEQFIYVFLGLVHIFPAAE
jgi:hypothetical protein